MYKNKQKKEKSNRTMLKHVFIYHFPHHYCIVYNYLFYLFSVSFNECKEFMEFTNTESMKILKHCSTRWLSLERCVSRTLQQWPAFQSYFQSHADCKKPGSVNRCVQFLDSDEMWLYFNFLEFVLPVLSNFNVMFQVYIK